LKWFTSIFISINIYIAKAFQSLNHLGGWISAMIAPPLPGHGLRITARGLPKRARAGRTGYGIA